jgi:tetratricopeptide (TPR) repeat protein
MKFANKILPFLIMAMLFAIPSFAQTGMIEGKVLDKEGKPIQNADITIDRIDLAGQFKVKSDKNGLFRASVPTASYKVTVTVNGAVVDFINGLRVSTGEAAKADFDAREAANRSRAADENLSPEEKAKRDADKQKNDAVKAAFDAGVAALAAKNYNEAVTQFQTAATADPSKDIIWGNLGMALSGAKKYDDAANAYKKAIELKPQGSYYNNLGLAYGNANKMEDAVAAMQKSAELEPTGAAQAYFNLGALMTNKGKTKEAAEAFKKATEFDPNNADAYYQLGISLMAAPATMKESIPMFEKVISIDPKGPNADVAKQMIDAVKAMK